MVSDRPGTIHFTPPLPHGDHRPPSHRDHPDPHERASVERGLPGGNREKRDTARHPAPRPGILEAMDRIPRRKAGSRQRCFASSPSASASAPEPPTTRDPGRQTAKSKSASLSSQRRSHEPLQRPRHSRDLSRGLKQSGKGDVTHPEAVTQQRLNMTQVSSSEFMFWRR
jgi:hypothetical protein